MKRLLSIILVFAMAMTIFVGCGSNDEAETTGDSSTDEGTNVEAEIELPEELVIYFVPSRDPEEIVTATEPLKEILQAELADLGYEFEDVRIEVGTTYEAAGEAIASGTAHIAFIPGGTYVLYSDEAEVILTATRAGLSKDFDDAADWNDGLATEATDDQVTYYRSLIVAGPSEKGQAIAEKVNNGEELTWEDVNDANWGVASTTSSAGYIYPTIWLQDNFGKTITDLDSAVQTTGYADAMARLASEQMDVIAFYADARRDYEEQWTDEFGRELSIWDETNVIGVTEGIYNDTISVTTSADFMNEDFIDALQTAFINIANTEEGLEIISIYSHEGYQIATDADYDGARKAQEIMKEFE